MTMGPECETMAAQLDKPDPLLPRKTGLFVIAWVHVVVAVGLSVLLVLVHFLRYWGSIDLVPLLLEAVVWIIPIILLTIIGLGLLCRLPERRAKITLVQEFGRRCRRRAPRRVDWPSCEMLHERHQPAQFRVTTRADSPFEKGAAIMCADSTRRIALAVAVFATSVSTARGQHRTWTDNTGKFSIEADLVEVKQDRVVLKKTDSSTITVPIGRLSDADQKYLKSLEQPGSPAGAQSPRDAGAGAPLSLPDAVTEPPSWNDANVPYDLAAFLHAPPAEENAAPLYLAALFEFGKSEMSCLFPEVSEHELKQWYSAERQLLNEQRRLEAAWEKDPSSVDPEAVDAWLANYDTGFAKLAAAQQRPKCMFQTGWSMSSLLPHAQVVRQVARVVQWRTRRDIQRGDLERPLQDLRLQLRLNRDLRVRGALVAQRVSIALDSICCEVVRMFLNAPGLEARHCDRLLALLSEHEAMSIDAFAEGNRAEYIHCRQAIHDLQHRTGDFDPKTMRDTWGVEDDMTSPLACYEAFLDLVGGGGPEESAKVALRLKDSLLPGAWQGGKMLSDEDYTKEVDAFNQFFASILDLAEQADFWRSRNEAEMIAPLYDPLSKTTFIRFLVPAEEAVIRAVRRNKAQLRGTQCLVALRRWQLEHEDSPPDVEALAKAAGLDHVPVDPYSDQPFRLGTVKGTTVIYSIGPDGKDDKANVEWNLAPNQPGDFIFRLHP